MKDVSACYLPLVYEQPSEIQIIMDMLLRALSQVPLALPCPRLRLPSTAQMAKARDPPAKSRNEREERRVYHVLSVAGALALPHTATVS